jgi:hypothetical protein
VPLAAVTKKKEDWNREHSRVRSLVDHPFADMKSAFRTLKKPWAEDFEQLDCLFFTAVGVHNVKCGVNAYSLQLYGVRARRNFFFSLAGYLAFFFKGNCLDIP